MNLYDEAEIVRVYVESEVLAATRKQAEDVAKDMLSDGKMSIDKIADVTGLPLKEVERLQSGT